MFILFLPQAPLRTLRFGESLFVFSLAEALRSQRFIDCHLYDTNNLELTPRSLRLCEKYNGNSDTG